MTLQSRALSLSLSPLSPRSPSMTRSIPIDSQTRTIGPTRAGMFRGTDDEDATGTEDGAHDPYAALPVRRVAPIRISHSSK